MKFDAIPGTLRNYRVPARVLEETAEFLRERGALSAEGVVLWLGEPMDERSADVAHAYVPEQVAYRSEQGVAVEVTQEGLTRLIASLPRGMFVLARVHAHPNEAYHSSLDDQNMLISHQGAISIVVPFFAEGPLELGRASVNELVHGEGWHELLAAEVEERFEIV